MIGLVQQGHLWRQLRSVILDRHPVGLNEEFLLNQMLNRQTTESGFLPDVISAVSPGGGMAAESQDIARGGDSLRVAREELLRRFAKHNVKTAALFCHNHSRFKPDFYAIETRNAVFPDWKHPHRR